MGNHNYREKMISAIEKGRIDAIYQIVEAQPQVLDEDLAKDMQVTPLARAVWRGDFNITEVLIKLGAKVDNGGSSGVTPLMWAAKRDNAYMVSVLIGYGADVTQVSNEDFNALDYAIVHGNYRPALFIYDTFQQVKDIMSYYRVCKDKDYRYVNYEIFITYLRSQVSLADVPNFFKRPEKKKLLDPVADPREPWRAMVSRLAEFETPPMVERSSLPQHLQPQNRLLGRVRTYINSVGTPREERSNSVIDEEKHQMKDELPQQQFVFIIIINMEFQQNTPQRFQINKQSLDESQIEINNQISIS